jgi:predicted ribosome quality control (RQC) complex YloA/Tae2 family protein
MLSLAELRRVVSVLDRRLEGFTLHRVVQADAYRLALLFHGGAGNEAVLLNCGPDSARISALPEVPPAPPVAHSFGQYLRAHLHRSAFGGISVPLRDRMAFIRLLTKEGSFELVLSILGARSNVYLLDSARNLVHSMRPLEDTRRELAVGAAWHDPPEGVRSEGIDRWCDLPDAGIPEAVETAYARLEAVREADALSRRMDAVLRKEEAYLSRKTANLHEDLVQARTAEEVRRRGELLKTVLHEIEPGTSTVAATDFRTGERVVIELDPRLSPAENLETLFRRYQKEARGRELIEEQLTEARTLLEEVSRLRDELRRTTAAAELAPAEVAAMAEHPRIRRLLARSAAKRPDRKPPIKPPAGRKELPSKLMPKRYKGEHGLEIWVGKSDEGNDYLTTRLARGNDLFFHLEGYPGSHVVLRTEGKPDPPPEAVIDACELAVHFSKMKNATRADIHVAHIKDVKKPSGAKPGLVYVTRGKTVHLRRNPSRLESILASRLDE